MYNSKRLIDLHQNYRGDRSLLNQDDNTKDIRSIINHNRQTKLLVCFIKSAMHSLKDAFVQLVQRYNQQDETIVEKMWNEINVHYGEKHRSYHKLQHLENMLAELQKVREAIQDWDVVLFALLYHDIIYKATKKDNEEKSASLAQQRLNAVSFPADKITRCSQHILATKAHQSSPDNDTNLFTDADLSILGQSRDLYTDYSKQVRKEYAIYPDFLYNTGRKKVLQHFLSMDRIFKTPYFYDTYEQPARANIVYEIGTL